MYRVTCIVLLDFLLFFAIVQIATQGILKYCLQGLLAHQQQKSFFFFLDILTKLLQETHLKDNLDQLEEDMNVALAQLEKDFPVSMQVTKTVHVLQYNLAIVY